MASGSVAMMADAWHTLSDTLTSVVVLVGFWIKKMPPDKELLLATEEQSLGISNCKCVYYVVISCGSCDRIAVES